jgi:hypothetical protein
LKVPNGALRWRPTIDGEELRAIYEKRGIAPARPVAWRLRPGDSIEPVQVTLGITDHAYTAITAGALHEGDIVITGAALAKGSALGTLVPGK